MESDIPAVSGNSEKVIKKYKRLLLLFIITTALFGSLLGFGIFFNYDYLVFKILMAGNYVYTEVLDTLYEEQVDAKEIKNYYADFDDVVIGVFTEKLRTINNDRYTYLYTPSQYTLSKETTKTVAKEAEIKELSLDWVYMRIPNISYFTRDFINDNKEKLNEYNNIIIDLQSNYGGDLEALYDIEELFLEKGSVLGYEVARSSFFTKTIKSKNNKFFDFENIVFLQNRNTASAAEGFIMAIRENMSNVKVIGTQSFGKGIGQITIPLKKGYAVKATVIRIETPLGNSIHQVGITPDILYENEEDILEFTLSLYKEAVQNLNKKNKTSENF